MTQEKNLIMKISLTTLILLLIVPMMKRLTIRRASWIQYFTCGIMNSWMMFFLCFCSGNREKGILDTLPVFFPLVVTWDIYETCKLLAKFSLRWIWPPPFFLLHFYSHLHLFQSSTIMLDVSTSRHVYSLFLSFFFFFVSSIFLSSISYSSVNNACWHCQL